MSEKSRVLSILNTVTAHGWQAFADSATSANLSAVLNRRPPKPDAPASKAASASNGNDTGKAPGAVSRK